MVKALKVKETKFEEIFVNLKSLTQKHLNLSQEMSDIQLDFQEYRKKNEEFI